MYFLCQFYDKKCCQNVYIFSRQKVKNCWHFNPNGHKSKIFHMLNVRKGNFCFAKMHHIEILPLSLQHFASLFCVAKMKIFIMLRKQSIQMLLHPPITNFHVFYKTCERISGYFYLDYTFFSLLMKTFFWGFFRA